MDKPESPEETVARLERIRPEERTKAERAALNSAKYEVERAEAARGGRHSSPAAIQSPLARTREDSTPGDPETMRAKLPALVMSRVHSAMLDLADVPPKDRASILSLGAKLSGLLAAQESEDPPPFLFRGWEALPAVAPAGFEPPPCEKCGCRSVGPTQAVVVIANPADEPEK